MTNETNFISLKPCFLSTVRIAKYSCKKVKRGKSVPRLKDILFKDPQFSTTIKGWKQSWK